MPTWSVFLFSPFSCRVLSLIHSTAHTHPVQFNGCSFANSARYADFEFWSPGMIGWVLRAKLLRCTMHRCLPTLCSIDREIAIEWSSSIVRFCRLLRFECLLLTFVLLFRFILHVYSFAMRWRQLNVDANNSCFFQNTTENIGKWF